MSKIDAAGIQPEGYVIKTSGNELYIIGKDKTDEGMAVDGTLNGTYAFLEKFVGVRWLTPQPEVGEVVPKMASLSIGDVDLKEEPLLLQRRIRDCKRYGHTDRIPQILDEWGVSRPEWEKFCATRITGAWFRHQRLGSRVKLNYTHGYNGWWDRFSKEHPDIFAMQPNGSRINTNARERLCISNPKLWQMVADEKAKQLKADPQLTCASISPNDDGVNKFCCCDKCAAWDPPNSPKIYGDGSLKRPQISLSDRFCKFYNEIGKLVAKQLPGRYLGCYAYSFYKDPPVTVDHLEKNLFVAFIESNEDYFNENVRQNDRQLWLKWSKLANQLAYRPNLFWLGMGLPLNYSHKLAEDIRFMADNGMRAADIDGLIGNWGSEGLQYYVAAKVLWNPSADVNAIIDDYCRAAYGKGASAMKAYYWQVEQLTNKIALEGKYTNTRKGAEDPFGIRKNSEDLFGYYTDDVLKQLQTHLDKALAEIGKSDDAAAERVRLVATSLEYTKHARDLVLTGYQVRTGKKTEADFATAKASFVNYAKGLTMSWAVSSEHDYSYMRNSFIFKTRKVTDKISEDPDRQAPTPNPMTWSSVPAANSSTTIAMTATTASDANGVEYFFHNTTISGHDSAWQDGTSWTDANLDPNTSYSYQVKARDKSGNHNETAYSTTASATTQAGGGTTPIYSDDFEYDSNTFLATWSITNPDYVFVGSAEHYTGAKAVKIKFISSMQKTISTVGYTDIHVKYARKAVGYESGDLFYAKYSSDGGSTWTTLDTADYTATSWAPQDKTCGTDAAGKSNFIVKFESNAASGGNRSTYVDTVDIAGHK